MIDTAIEIIKSGKATCVVMQDGVVVGEATGIGVKPILHFLENSDKLKEAHVADKIVGKAASMLLVQGGVRCVYGEVMSESGYIFLKNRDIDVSYGQLVKMIKSRTGTGMCPLEESVIDIDDIKEGYHAIKATIAKLMNKK